MTRLQALKRYQNMADYEDVANNTKLVFFNERSGQIDREGKFYAILEKAGYEEDKEFERIYPHSGIIMINQNK
jgi:5-methylcytosine-specific restriction endonuclease McrBC regulatory subunit McrC